MSNKNYEELIHLLLDNELDASEEAKLFAELANNSELRNEFRELLAIKNAVVEDRDSLVPPANTTLSLFNKLNLGTANQMMKVAEPSKGIVKKFLAPAVAAIILILLTSMVNYFYYQNEIGAKDKLIGSLLDQQKLNADIPRVSSYDNQSFASNRNAEIDQQVNTQQKKGIFDKSISKKERVPASPIALNEFPKENKVMLMDKSESAISHSERKFNFSRGAFGYEPINVPSLTQSYGETKESILRFTTELKGNISKSFPDIDEFTRNQTFTDYSLGLYFNMNDNHYFGLEGGKEFFTQKFYNVEDGINMEYMQSPSLFWVGVAYRYAADKFEFLAGGRPFVHLMVGFTELGPLGKSTLGLQYNAGNNFNFSFGVEGSLLIYQNQKVRYDSRKIGFMYGIMYNF